MRLLLLISLLLLSLTACYRMPTSEDYSVVPMINSPDFVHEGDASLSPTGNMATY